MKEDSDEKKMLYFKLIDYKRSVGTTQWTVISIFVTASEVVFAISLQNEDFFSAISARIFSLMIFWFGFFLFRRYRELNEQVSKYLQQIETDVGFNFQTFLYENFHKKGLPTKHILFICGIIYTLFAIILSAEVLWR